MRYQGGKVQLSKHIVPILEANRKPNQIYLEPFVGGASVVSQVSGTRIASDINSDVIAMWRAVQIGWNPPATVTEEEYENAKTDESIDPHLRAFIAVACSWGGKWFGGYARGENRNFADEAVRRISALRPLLSTVAFTVIRYQDWCPSNMLIYCDPPYSDSTQYDGVSEEFDHKEFWKTMQRWALHNTVFVSERVIVPDSVANLVWEKNHVGGIRSKDTKPTEKLYRVLPYDGLRW